MDSFKSEMHLNKIARPIIKTPIQVCILIQQKLTIKQISLLSPEPGPNITAIAPPGTQQIGLGGLQLASQTVITHYLTNLQRR